MRGFLGSMCLLSNMGRQSPARVLSPRITSTPIGRLPMPPSASSPRASTSVSAPAIVRLRQSADSYLHPGQETLTVAQAEDLQRIAGTITVSEMGFDPSVLQRPSVVKEQLARSNPKHPFLKGHVTYLHIHDTPHYSLGIFMLPEGSSIPLHDHPGMTVVSQLLFGTLHIKAYDPVPHSSVWPTQAATSAASAADTQQGPELAASARAAPVAAGGSGIVAFGRRVSELASSLFSSGEGGKRGMSGTGLVDETGLQPARLVTDEIVTAPTPAMLLYPDRANIHEFVALTDCAVLDLLTPPYSEDEGRDCTYYREVDEVNGDEDLRSDGQNKHCVGDLCLLEPVDADFFTRSAPYLGHPVR